MAVDLIPLEKVAKIYAGSNLNHSSSSDMSSETQGCPWVMVENLHSELIEHTSRTLSLEEMRAVRVAPPQTVLFSGTGSIGKVGITGVHMAPSNNLFAVEFDATRVFPLYGMYCLSAMRSDFITLAKGAVYDSLRLSDFRKFEIPIPELSEQMLIAEKLQTIQRAIGLQQELLSCIDEAILAEFSVLFVKEIDAVVQNGDSKSLHECAEILLNGAAKSKQPGSVGVCYISTAQLEDWEISYDRVPVCQVGPNALSKFQLHSGDIVMNRINQLDRLGRCGIIVYEPAERTLFGQNTLRIRVNPQVLESLFLFEWLKHPFTKQYIQHNAKSSTSFQSSLSKQVLANIPVPIVALPRQQAFCELFQKYLIYTAQANSIVKKLQELQQVWNNRILAFCQGQESADVPIQEAYRSKRYWIIPTGVDCFFDTYLECIQAPLAESRKLKVSQLPSDVEIQFMSDVRGASDADYGALCHIRLCKLSANKLRRVWMQPEAYRPEDTDSPIQQQLDNNGLISDQQDFGYIRQNEEIAVRGDESVASLLAAEFHSEREPYTRFARMPAAIRSFIRQLSAFQQGIYEEFLMAMQPLTCHMIQKQMRLRTGKHRFPGHSIQDVIATVRLLERFGLLERKQGFQLEYFTDDFQDKKREPILDHQGHAILIDTWTWLLPEGGNSL